MSYYEYYDVFEAAQKKDCKYRLFVCDGIGHKKVADLSKYLFDLDILVNNVTSDLLKLEKERDIKIIERDEGTIFLEDQFSRPDIYFGDKYNPGHFHSDIFAFSIYNNSISEEEFLKIMKENLKKLDLDYKFYYATGLYETNLWAEGDKKCFRGYAIPIIEEIAKKNYKKEHKFVEMEQE